MSSRSQKPSPRRNAPGSFLRRLPVTLMIAMVLWLAIRPVLDSAVARFAEVLVRSFEYPRVTRLVVADHSAEIRRADFRTDSAIPAVPLTSVHFNTIVLLALFFALPRPYSRRQLERLFMGWCVLYLTQSLNLAFHLKFMYATTFGEWSQQHYSDFARNLFGFLQYFTDLPGRFSFPFLIWLGFNWDVVMGMLHVSDEPEKPRKKKQRAKR